MENKHWRRGQIDALALPSGMFINVNLTARHIETVRNNTSYREYLEKASRIAGYVPPVLSISRGRISHDNEASLIKQNSRAEQLIKEKRNESIVSDTAIV
jgi:hypothetical protein